MEILNADFRKLNADTGQIVAGFVDIAADVDVEFRLAKRDPSGNCHSGINRLQDELTYEGNNEMKQLIHWPRNSYMNVYVAASAAGAAGYTNYPSDWGANTDGIVLKHDYVGSIGTSNTYRSRTLTHECGHWLNLPHTWGSSNNPNEEENCDVDDGVEDTPLCLGSPVGFMRPRAHHLRLFGQRPELHGVQLLQHACTPWVSAPACGHRLERSTSRTAMSCGQPQNLGGHRRISRKSCCVRAVFSALTAARVCLGDPCAVHRCQLLWGDGTWSWDFGDGTVSRPGRNGSRAPQPLARLCNDGRESSRCT